MEPWFAPELAGLVGGIGGATVGVLFGGVGGGLGSMLASRGTHRTLVLGYFATWGVLGLIGLITGIVALVGDQPYHVYYPFLLLGGMCTLLSAVLYPVMLRQYRMAEERRMDAEQLRTS